MPTILDVNFGREFFLVAWSPGKTRPKKIAEKQFAIKIRWEFRRQFSYNSPDQNINFTPNPLCITWGPRSVVVEFGVFGAPQFSVERSRNTYFRGFWDLWTENRAICFGWAPPLLQNPPPKLRPFQEKTPCADWACADCPGFLLLISEPPASSRSLRLSPWTSICFVAPSSKILGSAALRSLVARSIRKVIRANRFARIIRNWNPYFYRASGRFARITPLSSAPLPPVERQDAQHKFLQHKGAHTET